MATETRSDEQIQQDVLAELKWDARVLPNEIGVSVKGGVVTLTGFVDSFYKKWAAEDAAHKVRGVSAVANDIEVKLPSTSERTDDDIAAAAVQALERDAVLGQKNVKVTVSRGWITLTGQVEWGFQKDEAERILRGLWGVKGVINLLTVKARPTPAALKQNIEQALLRMAELDAKRIQVEVQGSKAILKGAVRSWAEREEAERTAMMAPGITQIEDQIQVVAV